MLAIYKREMRAFFSGPVGYVFVAIFFAVSAGIFMSLTVQKGDSANYQNYFTYVIMLCIIEIPLLTMKLVSEERKMKTDQLIVTAPVSLFGIVMAKFLAAYTLFGGSFLVSSIIYYIPLKAYGTPESATYIGSVIAVLLIGAAFVAIGEFISSLTENQFLAAFGACASHFRAEHKYVRQLRVFAPYFLGHLGNVPFHILHVRSVRLGVVHIFPVFVSALYLPYGKSV